MAEGAGRGPLADEGFQAPPPAWSASLLRWIWLGPLLASMLLPFAWMAVVSLSAG